MGRMATQTATGEGFREHTIQSAISRRATLRTAAADQEVARRGLCPSASSAATISR